MTLISVRFFDQMLDVLQNWAGLPLPTQAPGVPVVLPQAIFAAKFLKNLARAAEKLQHQLGGQSNVEWVEIRDSIAGIMPVGNVPNFNVAKSGRDMRDRFINDIDVLVAMNIVFHCPFRPYTLSTHILYAFKGLCSVESNLSTISCAKVVERWNDLAMFGGNVMGYTGYGNIRMNFFPLLPNIARIAFTAPPPVANYVVQILPPLAINARLTNMLGRIFPHAFPPATVGRALQLAILISRPTAAGTWLQIVDPIVLHAAMRIVLNFLM